MSGAVTGWRSSRSCTGTSRNCRIVPSRSASSSALDRRLGGGGIAEPVAGGSVQQRVHGRAAQVEHLRGAVDLRLRHVRDHRRKHVQHILRAASNSASAAAAMRIPAPSRRRRRGRRGLRTAAVSPSRTCVQDPAAHFHREHAAGERGPHRLRGAELRQGVLEPALPEPHEAAHVAEHRLRLEPPPACVPPVQPSLGLVDATQPRERRRTRGDGRSDDAMGPPAVPRRASPLPRSAAARRGPVTRRSRRPAPGGRGTRSPDRAVRCGGRAPAPLRGRDARIIDVQRPQLGDAEVHQRRRLMVVGTLPAYGRRCASATASAVAPRRGRRAARQPEPGAGQLQVEEPPSGRRAPSRPDARPRRGTPEPRREGRHRAEPWRRPAPARRPPAASAGKAVSSARSVALRPSNTRST